MQQLFFFPVKPALYVSVISHQEMMSLVLCTSKATYLWLAFFCDMNSLSPSGLFDASHQELMETESL